MNSRQLGYAALIGDVTGSRTSSRARLQRVLVDGALARTNLALKASQPLQVTVGDEFQGLYASLADALEATLWVRLHLVAGGVRDTDVRFGVGWGTLAVFDPDRLPFAQDGPAWWAAREALDLATREARRPKGPKGLGTWFLNFESLYASAPERDRARWDRLERVFPDVLGSPGRLQTGLEDVLNGYLLCRDQLVFNLGPNDAASVIDLLNGLGQAAIAKEQGVSQSAISQRFMRNGAYALKAAQDQIRKALT